MDKFFHFDYDSPFDIRHYILSLSVPNILEQLVSYSTFIPFYLNFKLIKGIEKNYDS